MVCLRILGRALDQWNRGAEDRDRLSAGFDGNDTQFQERSWLRFVVIAPMVSRGGLRVMGSPHGLERVDHNRLKHRLDQLGWTVGMFQPYGAGVELKPPADRTEWKPIVIPYNPVHEDYATRLDEALKAVAAIEGRPVEELLPMVESPGQDTLLIRVAFDERRPHESSFALAFLIYEMIFQSFEQISERMGQPRLELACPLDQQAMGPDLVRDARLRFIREESGGRELVWLISVPCGEGLPELVEPIASIEQLLAKTPSNRAALALLMNRLHVAASHGLPVTDSSDPRATVPTSSGTRGSSNLSSSSTVENGAVEFLGVSLSQLGNDGVERIEFEVTWADEFPVPETLVPRRVVISVAEPDADLDED